MKLLGRGAVISTLITLVALSTLTSGAVFGSSTARSVTPSIRHSGTLNIVSPAIAGSTFNPYAAQQTTMNLPNLIPFEALFTYNAAGKEVPQLATSYQWSPNRLQLKINLRQGVTFQDGTPFNAHAVAYDFEYSQNPAIGGADGCGPYFANVTSFVAAAPYQVQVNFSTPYSPFISILGGELCTLIASPTALQSEGTVGFGKAPVGTGPYQYSSGVLGSSVTFTRFAKYWQKGEPYFNQVTITAVGSDTACIAAVQSGTAQICTNANAADVASVKHVRNIKIESNSAPNIDSIRMNLGAAPFNNIWARKALAQAVNAEALSKGLYDGLYTPTQNYETPACFCFTGNKVHGYPQYNSTLVKQDLSHLPGGTLSFTLLTQNTPAYITEYEAVQAQLATVGITMTIDPLTETAVLALVHAHNFQAQDSGLASFPDPDALYYKSFDSKSTGNSTGLSDPKFDQLVEEARQIVNPADRKKLYAEAQERLALDLPQVALWALPQYYIVSTKIQGFLGFGQGGINTAGVYLS